MGGWQRYVELPRSACSRGRRQPAVREGKRVLSSDVAVELAVNTLTKFVWEEMMPEQLRGVDSVGEPQCTRSRYVHRKCVLQAFVFLRVNGNGMRTGLTNTMPTDRRTHIRTPGGSGD